MPISDMIFSALGVADFVFLLLFVAATGFLARTDARTKEKPAPPTEAGTHAR